jgi:hypothetical protein
MLRKHAPSVMLLSVSSFNQRTFRDQKPPVMGRTVKYSSSCDHRCIGNFAVISDVGRNRALKKGSGLA